MNLQHERIAHLCEQLKLGRIGTDWPHLAQSAASEESSFADFLERLLRAESEARAERGPSSFRVEPNSHNDSWSSSPVGMCAGRFSACAHVHEACLIRRMSPWALP